MIGTKYPSEMRTYIDPKTGHLVTQLTQNGQNFHMYFTDNSFDIKGNDIYFFYQIEVTKVKFTIYSI